MIDYHLSKRDYLEESKKKLKKQIEMSECSRSVILTNLFLQISLMFICFLCCLCIYVVVICVNAKISWCDARL